MLPTLITRAGSSAVPACRSAGSSAWTSQNGDFRFKSSTLSHAESGKLSNGSPQVAPALLTSMCRPSESAETRSASLRQPPRHHQANPPGAAGDKRSLAGQVEKLCVGADLVVCHGYGSLYGQRG